MSHDIVKSLARILRVPLLAIATAAALALAAQGSHAAGDAGARAATQGLSAPELALRRHITVDANVVTLGDIFEGRISGLEGVDADTVVAYAPQPGRRAVFDAEWLARTAHRHRLNWRPATRLDRVVVDRTSTVIGAELIAEALLADVRMRGYGQEYELELSNRNLLLHIDSRKPATVEVVNLAVDVASERFNAIVAIPAGDPNALRTTVAGRLFALVEVPVPTRTLRPGTPIRENDVKWGSLRAHQLRGNVVTDIDDLIGMEPSRTLRGEVPVRRNDVRIPQAVAKGDTVTMVYRTASMLLSSTGRAEESGATGDVIPVRNIQTRLVVEARIAGPGQVVAQITPHLASNQE